MKKIVLLFVLTLTLFANIGKISAIKGDVFIQRDNKDIKAKANDEIQQNDLIITKNNAKAQIVFIDNTIITLGKNTNLNIKDYVINGANSKVNLEVNSGVFQVISGEISKIARDKFIFQAKTATIGIRGTVFMGNLNNLKNDKVACLKGAIDVKIGKDKFLIKAGKEINFTQHKMLNINKINNADYSISKTNYSTQKNDYKKAEYKKNNIKDNYYDYKQNNYKKYNNANFLEFDITKQCHGNPYCIENKSKYAGQKYYKNQYKSNNKGNYNKDKYKEYKTNNPYSKNINNKGKQ
ncbi:FecR family protein [Campylobacter canadensis]|uniref:FecR domain-containing protein n=1 Tax=Campylobacter canadensis TaxID=449520 RepID=A0ABS7WQX3_9BACT|nr:FecR family protein [Campylobacter canadensis]MBZ7986707.1 FecR domain-containing protein [Campylobacter canadensis]MBZ7994599.1 FecR domain-containing protein [Campylobacter canadensis]MBZ7996841.1 FecR domain-containing protein [Campylobacter canadensis]MBZ7997743.1 FecR domain-containing protein [Campylobacter canadensis]MBZ7999930.1 FecR domain-containing protein [Campylobacter canadensis]